MNWLWIIVCIGCSIGVAAQETETHIIQGNEHYRKGAHLLAVEEYNKALKLDPENMQARLNLANTLFRQGQEVEALQLFTQVATSNAAADIKAKAWYNKGVILSKQKNLKESIEAYKNSLRLDPNDVQARENLQKAMLELKKQQPPSKDQNKQQKKKKEEEQQKKQQPKSKMSPKEAEQRLKLLQQKEKEVQEKVQQAKARGTGSQGKDW